MPALRTGITTGACAAAAAKAAAMVLAGGDAPREVTVAFGGGQGRHQGRRPVRMPAVGFRLDRRNRFGGGLHSVCFRTAAPNGATGAV